MADPNATLSRMASDMAAGARLVHGRETLPGTSDVYPLTPIALVFDHLERWDEVAWLVASAGIKPYEERLGTFELLEGPITWFDREQALEKRIVEGIRESGKNKDRSNVRLGMRTLGGLNDPLGKPAIGATGIGVVTGRNYERASQAPIAKWNAWEDLIGEITWQWTFAPRIVNGKSVLSVDAAAAFWRGMVKMAIAADANLNRDVVTLGDKLEELGEVSLEKLQLSVDWAARKAAGAVDFVAETAGSAILSFASASGVVAVLVVGAGVYYLASPGGAAGTSSASGASPPAVRNTTAVCPRTNASPSASVRRATRSPAHHVPFFEPTSSRTHVVPTRVIRACRLDIR